MRSAAAVAFPVLVPRAVVLWGLIRLVFAALGIAGQAGVEATSPSPIAIIGLCGIAGLLDAHVRRERLLWANLSLSDVHLWALYAAPALPAELALALVFG